MPKHIVYELKRLLISFVDQLGDFSSRLRRITTVIISGCQKLSRPGRSCGEKQSNAAKDAGQERVFKRIVGWVDTFTTAIDLDNSKPSW